VPGAVDDPWLARAIVSSSKHHSSIVLEQLLSQLRIGPSSAETKLRYVAMIADLITTAEAAGLSPAARVAREIADAPDEATWVFPLAAACAQSSEAAKLEPASREALRAVYQRAKLWAADEAASSDLRCQALQLFGRSLGAAEQERSLLGELLSPATPLEVQLAAVERLAACRDAESSAQLLSRWSNLSFSVREACALRLITSSRGTEALLAALESGEVLADDLSPSVRQILSQIDSQSMQARIRRVLGKPAAANQELIQQYLLFQQREPATPDLARGREYFQKHCAACHVPDAAGRAAGPNLSNLTDRSLAALTESILAPNRLVEPQYRGYMVATSDGQVMTGTIAEEAGDTLVLNLADGKRATIRRSDIEDFRSTGISLMPEGFQQVLDPRMLRDLVEFLRSDSFSQAFSSR
jgi:putative heme-binding domain-containing protein